MKRILLLIISIVILTTSCCVAPPEGVEPKFKQGEIVIVENEKFVIKYYSYIPDENSFLYRISSLKNGYDLHINENSIIKSNNSTSTEDITLETDTNSQTQY